MAVRSRWRVVVTLSALMTTSVYGTYMASASTPRTPSAPPDGSSLAQRLSTVTTSAPSAVLSSTSGPPTSTVTVTGSHFGAYETVDVYFDTKDEKLASTSASGAFVIRITVPVSASPGDHWVTASGRRSGLSAQAPFLVRTNWSEFGATNDRDGYNQYENVIDPRNASSLSLDWYLDNLQPDGQIYSSPAVVDGVVYIGDGTTLYARNAATGASMWSDHTDGFVSSSPAVVDGVVYVGDGNSVIALDAATGSLRWTFVTGGPVSSPPAVADGVIYVGSGDDDLYALDASTGKLRWSHHTHAPVTCAPALAAGVVYIGSGDHDIYALYASGGKLLWSQATGNPVDWLSVANGVLYSSGDYVMYAIDASTGTQLWTFSHNLSDGFSSSPTEANGVVYVGSVDDHLYAVNATTGSLLWSYATGAMVTSSTVANGVIYVGSLDKRLYALNATSGKLLWSYLTGGFVYSSPAVANGVVYIGSGVATVYAFHLLDGTHPPSRPQPNALEPDLPPTSTPGRH